MSGGSLDKRRRKAFSDFKPNQYNDAISLSAKQLRRRKLVLALKWAAIVAAAVALIILGFIFTDALIKVSEQPYDDNAVYTANTATTLQPTAQHALMPNSGVQKTSRSTTSTTEKSDKTDKDGKTSKSKTTQEDE